MADPNIGHETLSRIGVIPIFLNIAWAFSKHLVIGPFRGPDGPTSWRRDISYAVIREVTGGFSVLQAQWLAPSTDKVYHRAIKSRRQKPNSVPLDDGAKGHWIGAPDAKYVMIYFHGGGYVSPSTPGHMKFQFNLQKDMTARGYSFSIFTLSYILAPAALYPSQLRQATSALRYLVEQQNRDPSTIFIGGDSAGANLASELLLHIARPHPLVSPINLSSKLCAALLISPWISFDSETPSFKKNVRSDYLTKRALDRASYAFVGRGKAHDTYSQPMLAPVDWWKDVAEKAVQDVFITGGGGELLIHDIRGYAAAIAKGFAEVEHGGEKQVQAAASEKSTASSVKGRVIYMEFPRQAHEEMIIDKVIKSMKKGTGLIEIEGWLSARL